MILHCLECELTLLCSKYNRPSKVAAGIESKLGSKKLLMQICSQCVEIYKLNSGNSIRTIGVETKVGLCSKSKLNRVAAERCRYRVPHGCMFHPSDIGPKYQTTRICSVVRRNSLLHRRTTLKTWRNTFKETQTLKRILVHSVETIRDNCTDKLFKEY